MQTRDARNSDAFARTGRSVKETIAGSFAGVAGTTLGHPLDLVKARLQTQAHYRGMVDCLVQVVRHEGLRRGLYKGIMPPLLSLTILNSLCFGTYHQARAILAAHNGCRTDLWHLFAAGSITGGTASIVSTPFEMLKVRMQLDNVHQKRHAGSWSMAKSLLREHGPMSFYTGFRINFVREMTFCSVYFGLYELPKERLSTHGPFPHGLPPWVMSLTGGVAGMTAWLVSYPLDVLKTNIQGQPLLPRRLADGQQQQPLRVTVFSAAAERWRTRGLAGFYTGVTPSVLRASIVSSVRFSAFELAMRLLTPLGLSSASAASASASVGSPPPSHS
eukprot:TRINITY_DN11424_c0_g1_i1.p1 TRINITY_DN11424_c0_g1~~TRINITY_DN11424_c0_g1_i1.p1  ORF type:complete len:331 (+),score=113.94 TRINITY_DN11424_c0_g1_i1:212-1204(+)